MMVILLLIRVTLQMRLFICIFCLIGEMIQCQNCWNTFKIDELDNLIEDSCNLIGIKDKFENKKCPKAWVSSLKKQIKNTLSKVSVFFVEKIN